MDENKDLEGRITETASEFTEQAGDTADAGAGQAEQQAEQSAGDLAGEAEQQAGDFAGEAEQSAGNLAGQAEQQAEQSANRFGFDYRSSAGQGGQPGPGDQQAEQPGQAGPAGQFGAAYQAQTGAQQQAGPQKPEGPGIVSETIGLARRAVTRPIDAFREARRNTVPALILGGVELVLVFLTTLINLPLGINANSSIKYMLRYAGASFGGIKARIALIAVVLIAASIVLYALAAWLFRDKEKTDCGFVGVLASFCVFTVPGSIAAILVFVFGLFSSTLAMVFLCLGATFWSVYTIKALFEMLSGDENKEMIKTVLVVAVVGIIIGFFARLISGGLLQDMAGLFMNVMSGMF